MRTIEIFKTGTHQASNGTSYRFDAGVVQQLVDGYDVSMHEAPVVIGHPKSDAPAFAWVKQLAVKDGIVLANIDQIDPEFAEMVKEGKFKKVSASFYPPNAPGNPTPDAYYLRHVGFLGAQPPAVKGLKSAQFAEDEDGLVEIEFVDEDIARAASRDITIASVFRRLRDWIIERDGIEAANKALPDFEIDYLRDGASADRARNAPSHHFSEPENPPKNPETPMPPEQNQPTPEEIAAASTKLAEDQEAFEKQRTEFAEKQAQARRKENQTFLDELVKDGRLAPGFVNPALDFMDQLDAEEAVEFADAKDKQTPLDWFKGLLGQSGQVVDFSEHSKPGDKEPDPDAGLDPNTLAQKAVEFQESEKAAGRIVSTEAAVRHVAREMAAA